MVIHADGIAVVTITDGALSARVLNIGAALMDMSVLTPGGKRSVILSLDNPEAYENNPHYLGVIAGRCANRIRHGEGQIEGRPFQLDRNDNEHHLHGGSKGFGRRLWTLVSASGRAASLELRSPDGDQGYPGELRAVCRYEILPGARLRITLTATADAATLANLAPHAYFNLLPGSSILDHELQIRAARYTPVDEKLIPDGRLLPVDGTCFDFRDGRRIGSLRAQSPIGYDHNFVLAAAPRESPDLAAKLTSPDGKLAMEIYTTEPGLQFYDGSKLSPAPDVKNTSIKPFAGCCLEPQRFPDAIHHPHFASAVLPAGCTYRHITEYKFYC